jgi:Pentapeptide repeats (8 copies)
MTRASDPRTGLAADCARCLALCCVGPGQIASADFALDKPPGRPCVHLCADDRCGIHDDLRERGFAGCVAYDCFGAGQHVVQVTFAGRRTREPAMDAVLPVLRQLHELRWYLEEVLDRPVAAPLHPAARQLRDVLVRLGDGTPDALLALDVSARRAEVVPVLRRASALVRADYPATRRAPDLVGAKLRRARLAGADLRGTLLIAADLRSADLRCADLLGADLRGADLRGADLTGALFVTRTQLGSALGDGATRLPSGLSRPAHWR